MCSSILAVYFKMFKSRVNKRVRVAYPSRVCVQDVLWGEDGIQCDGCSSWFHVGCIQMSKACYQSFSSNSHYQFFCRTCGFETSGCYNFSGSLLRIRAKSPDINAMQQQARSEQHLLTFYGISLPPIRDVSIEHITVDENSVSLLETHSQWLMGKYVPALVEGDGNCFFRSVSLALFGSENYHPQLRLLASIEALTNKELYDCDGADFYTPFRVDDRLVLPGFELFITDLVKDKSAVDMLAVLCTSCVVQKPIQTMWPVDVHEDEPPPLTKLVVGRGVQTVNPLRSRCCRSTESVLSIDRTGAVDRRSRCCRSTGRVLSLRRCCRCCQYLGRPLGHLSSL